MPLTLKKAAVWALFELRHPQVCSDSELCDIIVKFRPFVVLD